MTVKEFVDNFNKAKDKEKYVEQFHVVDYIPLVDKLFDCERIFRSTYFLPDDSGNTVFVKNSVYSYRLYQLTLIDRYYDDIEVSFDNFADTYDALKKCGAIELLFERIHNGELFEYEDIYRATESDLLENERSISSYLDKLYSVMSRLALSQSPEQNTK